MTRPFLFDLRMLPIDKITLFDIRYNLPPENTASPWARTVKYALQLKRIPFHIVLVEMIEIPALSKALGLKPGEGFTPEPMYTLPAIYDPSLGRAVSDSLIINKYLDSQYPNTPQVVPPNTEGLIKTFLSAFNSVDRAFGALALERCLGFVTEASKDYFRSSREKLIGIKIEDITPKGAEEMEVTWAAAKQAFDDVDSWFGPNDFIMGGDEPTHVDLIVAGRLVLLRSFFGAESREWRDMETWNMGRWKKLLDYCNSIQC